MKWLIGLWNALSELLKAYVAPPLTALMKWMMDLWDAFCEFAKANLAPPLRALEGPLDAWIGCLPWWAPKACVSIFFLIAMIWALRLKSEYVYLGAPDRARWRDLRLWTALALSPYILLYLIC